MKSDIKNRDNVWTKYLGRWVLGLVIECVQIKRKVFFKVSVEWTTLSRYRHELKTEEEYASLIVMT